VLWFDPTSELAIAAAILRLLQDRELAAELAAAGPAHAARFSWQAAAAGTLESYARLLATR
jgi:glycosyltransferase involved in cell wall biosynthesis